MGRGGRELHRGASQGCRHLPGLGASCPSAPSPPGLLTWVLQLPTDDLVHQQGLPDHLGALSLLDRLGDEEEVGEEEAVDIHLGARARPWVLASARGASSPSPRGPHLAVFTFPHLQAALKEELPGVIWGGAGHGGRQVQPQELLQQLRGAVGISKGQGTAWVARDSSSGTPSLPCPPHPCCPPPPRRHRCGRGWQPGAAAPDAAASAS